MTKWNLRKNSGMVLQEYIPGEDWIYHGYCNSKAGLYVSFTGKKLLDYPPAPDRPRSVLVLVMKHFCIESEKFLRGISYSGIIDMDWRQDEARWAIQTDRL